MADTVEIPDEIRQLAERMGVDVNEVIKGLQDQAQATDAATKTPAAQGAGLGVSAGVPAKTAEGVDVVPTETVEDKLNRELAVAQQELQQTRKSMQTMQEGRVVGSSGLSGPVTETPPNLGGVEPGLRWAVRNGLIEVEKIADPLIRDLFKNDLGGVI